MSKFLKKFLITLLVTALVLGGLYGGLTLYKNSRRKPVNTYTAGDFAITDYWGDSSEAYGEVRTDKLQKVYPSDSQTVTEVFVCEGQEVKAGDPLLSYDTTLTDIDLEKAKISHQKLEARLTKARGELEVIRLLQPYRLLLITPEPLGIEYLPEETPQLISGTGTADDPFYVLFGAEDEVDTELLQALFEALPEEEEGPEEETGEEPVEGPSEEPSEEPEDEYTELYAAFVIRENDALNAPVTDFWGLRIRRSEDDLRLQYYYPFLSDEILDCETEPEPYYEEYGSMYSAQEIAEMRSQKEQEIADLNQQIRLSGVELERLQAELSDGMVFAAIDGTVKTVLDQDTALSEGTAMLEISAGGGYYIEVSMGEFDLQSMTIGQTVQVNSWESGMVYDGEVIAIGDTPSNDGNSWTNGNPNVSYYPFTVFVGEDAELREYEYVNVTYTAAASEAQDGLYLENIFIREEGGRKYVYAKGEDGLLRKAFLRTGKDLWGSYTQICEGLTAEDRVAFPYGTDVFDGAETVDASSEEFWNSSY